MNHQDATRRIIIVEDDTDFRESIVESLLLAGFDVTGVASAIEFYKKIAEEHYLLAIIDLGLPDQDGMVLAEYIRRNTDMRIIVLTAQSSLDTRITAYEAGADIYLLKPVDFAELTASIYSIVGRLEKDLSPQHKKTQPEPCSPRKPQPWVFSCKGMTLSAPGGETIKLTAKECALLEILTSNPGRTISRQELLDALDYPDDKYGNRSLDVLIHRLRQKNGKHNVRIPIKTVHGSGYCFSEAIVFA
ncbi:response regulator transcription factor [Prosthecochloris sp. GSB1]|uniref:response regulator transcription factor n=1 Tax=Prosthecochloris sp. GSB1 TaxID=281093 RepID=UPI00142D3450|nr:response regulator transcription factor [Prosthecochloris sp. GSB1]